MNELREHVRQYATLEEDRKGGRDNKCVSPIRKQPNQEVGRERGRFERKVDYERGLPPASANVGVNTVFKIPIYRILKQIKTSPFFKWPGKMRGDPAERDASKFCSFHREKGHMTEECRTLKHYLEYLVEKGHLKDFILNTTTDNTKHEP